MTHPPAKFDVDWSKETQKKLTFDLKPLFLASWQGFYSQTDPQNNPHLYLDMIYPSAKFDVDWSKEAKKNLMFDARPPARPPTDILILITRFHLVKTWLIRKNKILLLFVHF